MTAYFGTLGQPNSAVLQNVTGSSVRVSTFALTAALALNDTITMCYLPDNAVVLDVAIATDTALDTNAASTIAYDVGDAGSANRFIAAVAQGNNIPLPITASTLSATMGYQYTTSGAETKNAIIVTVHTAPATGATTGTLRLKISYSMQALGPYPGSVAQTDI
jgi:hypothetical protein